MAYEAFASVYDLLNGDADYDALFRAVHAALRAKGICDGIVADLGCGTGELTLRLADAGYDMIGVDLSCEMLSVAREKAAEAGRSDILLLQQDLTALDLYGTVRAAVSTFDTLNHIGPIAQMQRAIARAALFIEPDGLFTFDMNTPYKHETVLADNCFTLEEDGCLCEWENRYDAQNACTQISITVQEAGEDAFCEALIEYSYTRAQIEAACSAAGLRVLSVVDGERFCALMPDSQRFLFVCEKTQGGNKEMPCQI